MEIDPDTLEVLGTADSYINPLQPIEEGAFAIHGISDADVAEAPTLPQWLEQTLGGPMDGEITLIGYRVAFDLPMLRPIGNIVRTWDLLPLAQMMVPGHVALGAEPGTKPNHKLQSMRDYFSLPGGEAHRAMGDVWTTYQLLEALLPATGRSLRMLCGTEFQIWYTMPWGKHEGQPIISLPTKYKEWLLGLPELDPSLKKSVEMFYKTDRRIV